MQLLQNANGRSGGIRTHDPLSPRPGLSQSERAISEKHRRYRPLSGLGASLNVGAEAGIYIGPRGELRTYRPEPFLSALSGAPGVGGAS